MLIMNDKINARAPLPSSAPTPILPFGTYLSGILATQAKTIGTCEVNLRGKSEIYRIQGSINRDVCKDFASR